MKKNYNQDKMQPRLFILKFSGISSKLSNNITVS